MALCPDPPVSAHGPGLTVGARAVAASSRSRVRQAWAWLAGTLQGIMPTRPIVPGTEADQLLTRARAGAAKAGCPYVGGEHQLAAILATPGSLAGVVLARVEREIEAHLARLSPAHKRMLPPNRGAPRATLAAQLAQLRPANAPTVPQAALPFTRSALVALRLAEEDARQRGHDRLDSLHLLVGLLGEGEGLAASMLEAAGITLDAVTAAEQALKPRRPAGR